MPQPTALPYTYTIAAGATENVMIPCEFVHCISSTGVVYLKPHNSGGSIYFNTNANTRFVDEVNGFDIKNEGASPVTITLLIGYGFYELGGVAITGGVSLAPDTGFEGLDDVSVPATSAQLLDAANTSRRALFVTNPSTNASQVRIGGASVGATKGVWLDAGATICVTGTAAVWAYNPSGAALTLTLSEILA